jgi:hypothetical protein
MFCHKCGNRAVDESEFCHKCGAKLIQDSETDTFKQDDIEPVETIEAVDIVEPVTPSNKSFESIVYESSNQSLSKNYNALGKVALVCLALGVIASQLNIENVDCPHTYYYKQTGKSNPNSNECQTWGSNTVMQLLKNQVYIGHMVQGKRQVTSFKTKKRHFTPTDNWIIVENTHEPIVDLDTWNRVQERIEATKLATSNHAIQTNSTKSVSLFSGLIRCADCGSAMAFNKRVHRNGDHYTYRCSRYANYGKNQCSTHIIPQDTLEQVILTDMRQYAKAAVKDEQSLINRILSVSDREREREHSAKRQTATKHRKRLDAIDKMVKQLFEEKVNGGIPLDMFQKLLADYDRERKEIETQLRELDNELQTANDTERNVLTWLGLIKNCLSLKSLDRETAYTLIDNISVSEKIEIDGKKHQNILIQYNFVGRLD